LKGAAIKLRTRAKRPDNRKARYELGVVLLQIGELNAAEAQLRAALAHDTTVTRWRGARRSPVRLEKNQELLDEIPAAQRRRRSRQASVRARLCAAQPAAHRGGQASFEQAETMTAKPATAQFGLGAAPWVSPAMPRSHRDLKKALANDPKLVDGWTFLGQLQGALGRQRGRHARPSEGARAEPRQPGGAPRPRRAPPPMASSHRRMPTSPRSSPANPQDPLGNYLQALAHAKRQNFRAAENRCRR